ncbi:hypothetical protein JKF63_04932 [Porcisia hertigi]|uniref:RING-type E3 ubiquitin transferase n=1 Tax=Porcisia hertigi TaxID=2761500 RepID=A0A836IHJ9_9TRYP|nr:hypothetical protein JKF63_04932 [Porcisia hertigi]
MPKRVRDKSTDASIVAENDVVEVSDADSTTADPIGVEVMESQLDPLLERQLDALDVDEDFRESIRSMSPNTRRDVLNDIIRHQQHAEIEAGLIRSLAVSSFDSPGGSFFTIGAGLLPSAFQAHMMRSPHEESDAEDDIDTIEHADADGDEVHDSEGQAMGEEEEEEEEEEEDEDEDSNAGATSETSPFSFHGTTADSEDDTGGVRLHHIRRRPQGQRGALPSFIEILGLLGGNHTQAGSRSGDGDGLPRQGRRLDQRAILEGGMMSLQNLLRVLQQASTMESMGLDLDIDNMSYEELLELEERIGNVSKGVSPALLDSCMTPLQSASADAGTCAICQEDLSGTSATTTVTTTTTDATPPASLLSYSDKLCVKLLNCSHCFHKSCISQWLVHNKTCPICKVEVLPRSESSAPVSSS